MPDERDDLTPAQQLLGAAISLNEATYELMTLAQAPDILARILAHSDADGQPHFAEVFDKIAEGLSNLYHVADRPEALAPLADAAERWVRGEA